MCGILGVVGSLTQEMTNHHFSAALEKLNHRGPDDKGVWASPNAILGHTRLSIMDLSEKAHQPMKTRDGRYLLVFNGEIYNYRQLREQLVAQGVYFDSSGDSEVLLKAMIYWKEAAIPRLNGMFAFAFYDTYRDTVMLVRDRFGVKPLFYQDCGNGIIFSSEIKALRHLLNSQSLNLEAVSTYLNLGYNYAPDTIWKEINKLKPGYYLKFAKGKAEITRWYKQYENIGKCDTKQKAMQSLYDALKDAVRQRMISDVSLGAFLSGGIDSSIVVALMREITDSDIKTFTVTYKGNKNYDESEYAKEVANRFETKHHELQVEEDRVRDVIPEVLDHLDEPFADPSVLPTYLICKEIKKYVTVALSGDGADEAFAGYRKYLGEYYFNKWWLPFVYQPAKFVASGFSASRRNLFTDYVRKIKRFAIGLDNDPYKRYMNWTSIATHENAPNMVPFAINGSDHIRQKITELYDEIPQSDSLNRILYTDQTLVLEGNMLPKIDMMSMFSGLEVRSPFMDYRVIQLANSMPDRFKFQNGTGKTILRDLFRKSLPVKILKRPKQGFDIPVGEWFRDKHKDMFWDVIKTASDKKGINMLTVEKIYKEHVCETEDNSRILWAVFVWAWWWNRHY